MIEEVADCMNILAPLKGRSPVGVDERLFLIDTLDSCVIGSSKHFKAEQIVIEKEITQDEIIQYYLDHPELKPNIREDLWNEFCNDKIQPYVYVKEEKEIEDLIIKNCLRYGQDDLCAQISNDSYMEICEKCIGWQWRGDTRSNMKDYLYLIIRSKLYNGIELNCIEEYHKLEGYENERKSLRLISEYLKKQAIKLYDF